MKKGIMVNKKEHSWRAINLMKQNQTYSNKKNQIPNNTEQMYYILSPTILSSTKEFEQINWLPVSKRLANIFSLMLSQNF